MLSLLSVPHLPDAIKIRPVGLQDMLDAMLKTMNELSAVPDEGHGSYVQPVIDVCQFFQ